MRSACLAHLILHDLTTATFGEEYTKYGEPHYTKFSLLLLTLHLPSGPHILLFHRYEEGPSFTSAASIS